MLSLSCPCTTSLYCTKQLSLNPTLYPHGCKCGHNIKYRDLVFNNRRKNSKYWGVTIRPKIRPINITLK